MALAQQADPSASYASAALALPDSEALAARLREIIAQTTLPIEALDPALQAILEATGAAAGAVCVYDQRKQLLRLAAESGLSDEGCRRLRTIRRGDGMSWDMPLQGLLNRRAYLIESAAQNRYVPVLAEGNATVRAVACLPMYAGAIPVGSLVLVMLGARVFRERDVQALDKPLRLLAKLIEDVRREAAEGAAAAAVAREAPVPAPSRAAPAVGEVPESGASPEIDRLRAHLTDLEASAAHAERARAELEAALGRGASAAQAELQEALDEARRTETARATLAAENAALTAELEKVRAEIERTRPMVSALGTTEHERMRLAAALEALAEQHTTDLRTRAAGEAARVAELDAARMALQEALDAARRAEAARAGENVALTAELEQTRQEIERIRPMVAALGTTEQERMRLAGALEALVEQHATELRTRAAEEATRAAETAAEVERLEGQLAATASVTEQELTRTREDLEAELTAARTALQEALDAARRAEAARAGENAALTAELEQTRQEIERIRPMVAALGTTEQERMRLAEALEALAEQHATELRTRAAEEATRAAETAVEVERLEGRLAATASATEQELTRTREELEEAREQDRVLRTERAHLAHQVDEACVRQHDLEMRLEEQNAAAERTRASHAEEVAGLTARVEALVTEADGLRAEAAALQAERDRLVAEVEGGAAARACLEEEIERARQEVIAAEPAAVTVVEEEPALELEPEPGPVLEVAAALAVPDRASAAAVVVLDGNRAWERAGEVVVVEPDAQAAVRLGGLAPSSVIVNVAAAGAIPALVALRESGCTAPIWGCLADPARDRALALGRIEPASRPLDPDALAASLRRANVPRSARVVTVGDDVEGFVSLRQALTRDGMSVSMAWNAKQAADLFPMVRPAVVVLDLGLPGMDAASALALIPGTAGILVTVLVAGSRDPAVTGIPGDGNSRVGPLASVVERAVARPATAA